MSRERTEIARLCDQIQLILMDIPHSTIEEMTGYIEIVSDELRKIRVFHRKLKQTGEENAKLNRLRDAGL